MKYTREFEIITEDNGMVHAILCETGEEIFALNLSSAIDYCVAILRVKAESEALNDADTRKRVTGNEPMFGGYILPVTVDYFVEELPSVSLSEAARMLGVSISRVTQLCRRGQLISWKKDGNRLVSVDSIESRILMKPGPGHPKSNTSL